MLRRSRSRVEEEDTIAASGPKKPKTAAEKQSAEDVMIMRVAFYGDSNGVGTGDAKGVVRRELQKVLGEGYHLTMHVKGGACIAPKPHHCKDIMKFHFLEWLTKTGPRTRSGYNRPWHPDFGSTEQEWEINRAEPSTRVPPHLAIIMLGTNDIAMWKSGSGPPGGAKYQNHLKKHLKELMDHIQSHKPTFPVQFVLVVPPCARTSPARVAVRGAVKLMLDDFTNEYSDTCDHNEHASSQEEEKVAGFREIVLVECPWSIDSGDYDKDKVHLTHIGATKLAEQLGKVTDAVLWPVGSWS